jgi:hypothetical protein
VSYDPKPTNWYEAYNDMATKANELAIESVRLVQKIARLEQRLQIAKMTPERIYDMASHELVATAQQLRATAARILVELRRRHVDTREAGLE